jgi:uncharacterized membrane protein YhaH (DUF805 family)
VTATLTRPHAPPARLLRGRSLVAGGLGAATMAAVYTAVVWAASGSFTHLVDQVRTDWYLVALILAGFGAQVAFFAELRAEHRAHRVEHAAGATGTGASAAGMVACCAHHLADLVPLLGATGAAAFLYDNRVGFMLLGLAVNAVAITIAYRRLHAARTMEHDRCAA